MHYYNRRSSTFKNMFNRVFEFIVTILATIIVLIIDSIGYGLVVALPVQLLWNLCFKEIFSSIPQVGFVSVFGTIVMLRILKGVII